MKTNAFEYIYGKKSLSEKQKKEWYVNAADEIIDYISGLYVNDKESVKKDLELANGKVPIDFILEALRPYIPPEGKKELDSGHYGFTAINDKETPNAGTVPSYLVDVDFINQIKDRYIGEYIRQFSDLQVYNRDPDVVAERNKALHSHLKDLLEEYMLKLIEGKQPEEIEAVDVEKERKEFVDKWVDDKTIEYQHRLNLLNDLSKADIIYTHSFLNWFSTEHAITYRSIYNESKMRKEAVHPLEYYRIPNNITPFIKDDVGGVRKYKLNINEIITFFQLELSTEDIAYIKEIIEKHHSGNGYTVPATLIKSRQFNHSDINNVNDSYTFCTGEEVNIYHIVLQTPYDIKILTYQDIASGIIQKMEVDADYELDPDIGDIHLENFTTYKTIEFYRIGEKAAAVYTKPKEHEVQIGCLPYNGIVGYLGTGNCNPIPRRLAGLLALYKYYTLQQQRAVAKYKNWIIIPETLIQDGHLTMEEKLEFAKKDDTLFISDEDASANSLQAIRVLVGQGAERYIETLTTLRESIRKEAMDIAGMNEQRYGDTSPTAGKAVTEYAITRATTASIGLFNTFNLLKEEDAVLDLAYAKQIFKNGYKGSYFDKATKHVIYVDIPAEEYDPKDIGVFVKNSIQEQEKKQVMIDFAFNMGQAGEPLIAIEALDSESATQIKRLIKDTIKERQQTEEAMRKYEEQIKAEVEQIISDRELGKQEHEAKMLAYKEEMANLRTNLELDTQILLKEMELDNINADESNTRKYELEERKINLKKLEMQLNLYQQNFKSMMDVKKEKVKASKAAK